MEDPKQERALRLLRYLQASMNHFYMIETGNEPYFDSKVEDGGMIAQLQIRTPGRDEFALQFNISMVN